ncbi:hypothetical protein CROQUDRAFT_698420 [Cronartium quercuum f. sp. fusiforme G11]|uniref:Secreted protein n=1 Tax=Cronartium quercuum f. sp. fusiforme G11 TaxID=708437 RepID=A0A9P6THI1_9BASI|nr:hypothetical protein CROQUDRAFT_698420 [Cronartium quercuum f. sp. fusiforme G11]
MHVKIVFFFFLLALSSYVSADCQPFGRSWGDKSKLTFPLPVICRQLSGEYPAGSASTRCHPSETQKNVKYYFRVQTLANTSKRLTVKKCMKGMNMTLENCERGGTWDIESWRYVLQSLDGRC